jgi:uncharacterized Zn-finger protein
MASDGSYVALAPTRLGNLIYAYEDYPYRIYGLDSVFFWYRIWLKLGKDTRDEIDNRQALVDSALYVSASLVICSALTLAYGVSAHFGVTLYAAQPPEWFLLSLTPILLVGSFLLYRASLYAHATYGEIFKSIFDVYGPDLKFSNIEEDLDHIESGKMLPDRSWRLRNVAIWRYLQNYRIRSPLTDQRVPVSAWNTHSAALAEMMQATGAQYGVVGSGTTLWCAGWRLGQGTALRHEPVCFGFDANGVARCPSCSRKFEIRPA